MAYQILNDGETRAVHRTKINQNFSTHEGRLNDTEENSVSLYYTIQEMMQENLVMNPDFNLNLRGLSGTVTLTPGQYGHSCWKAGASGCVYTFASSGGQTTITIISGSLKQRIEGTGVMYPHVTWRWRGTAECRIDSGGYFGVGLGSADIAGPGVAFDLEFNVGTVTAVQALSGDPIKGYDLGRVQRRHPSLERLLVSRYARVNSTMVGWSTSTTGLSAACNFDHPMRSTANVTLLNGTGAVVDPGVGVRNLTVVPSVISPNGDYLDLTAAAGTANKTQFILPGRLHFSAEL